MSKEQDALKLALEAFEADASNENFLVLKHCVRKALAEQPAQQQEPVAWMWKDGTVTTDPDRADGTWTPFYTSPPASKPLTDEQIMEMYNEPRSDAEMIEFARAIEAAHGIKGDA